MYLISAKEYKTTGVHILIRSGEIWASMKNVHNSLSIRKISHPILKEIYGFYETKKCYKK